MDIRPAVNGDRGKSGTPCMCLEIRMHEGRAMATEAVMTATLKQARHLLKVVDEKNLTQKGMAALHDSGLLTDLLEAASRGALGKVDRTAYRHVLGLLPMTDESKHIIGYSAGPFIPDSDSPPIWPTGWAAFGVLP